MSYVSMRIAFGIICIIAFVVLFIYAVREHKIGKLESNLVYILLIGFVIWFHSDHLVFAFNYFMNETKTKHIVIEGVVYDGAIESSTNSSFLDINSYKRVEIIDSNGNFYIVNNLELREKIKDGGTVENGMINKEMTIKYVDTETPDGYVIK